MTPKVCLRILSLMLTTKADMYGWFDLNHFTSEDPNPITSNQMANHSLELAQKFAMKTIETLSLFFFFFFFFLFSFSHHILKVIVSTISNVPFRCILALKVIGHKADERNLLFQFQIFWTITISHTVYLKLQITRKIF